MSGMGVERGGEILKGSGRDIEGVDGVFEDGEICYGNEGMGGM